MSKTREVSLRGWVANYSVNELAEQRGIHRSGIYQALKARRKIFLMVDENNVIKKIIEYKEPVKIWLK